MDRPNPDADWKAPATGAPVRTFSIPLGGSRTFDLRFPEDLSREDFAFIVETMKLWERKMVATEG